MVTGLALLTGVLTACNGDEGPGEPEGASRSGASWPEPEKVETSETTDGTSWDRPRFDERREERYDLVDRIERRDDVSEPVAEAMRHVPRHLFVPERRRGGAYTDTALPIGHGQTISQPTVVAVMTTALELDADSRVLEVGTGSAYQAAVLAELTPHVYTIEIIEELAAQARERLHGLGYNQVKVRQGDGYFGWPEHAPFDAIIVTAAPGHVPPPLLKQLKEGGRMIIPVGGQFQTQSLLLLTKDAQGDVSTEHLMPVRFVPMTGRAQEGE
jgi:protein-L-isoaspartate(D-aspartate) O-methyltransferase